MLKEPADDGRLYGLAIVYHSLGRKAESDAALAQKDPFMGYMKAEKEPLMPTGDPRFKAFLRKMNLKE